MEVVLQRGEDIVAQAMASPFGEFNLEFSPAPSLRLFIKVPGHRTIGIVVPKLESSHPRASGEGQTK